MQGSIRHNYTKPSCNTCSPALWTAATRLHNHRVAPQLLMSDSRPTFSEFIWTLHNPPPPPAFPLLAVASTCVFVHLVMYSEWHLSSYPSYYAEIICNYECLNPVLFLSWCATIKSIKSINCMCIALNHSYSLKGLYRAYDYGPCDYDTPHEP